MVPQLLSGPGKLLVIDGEGCLSLEVRLERAGEQFRATIRDHAYPGAREPREALFYSVSDRDIFLRALAADRLESCSRVRSRRWLYRPRVALA